MPNKQSDESDFDSEEDEEEKVLYKKPQVQRLDKIKYSKRITINLSTTQYPVIADVADQLNWKVQYDMEGGDWDVYWTDIPIDTDTLIKMHLFQKINYYPGIYLLARKNLLGLKLMAMKQKFPEDYNFFPLTWMLPQQYSQFRQYYQDKPPGKTRTYIVKPEADCQGRGIFLTRKLQDLQNGKHYVVQRYITKPYLIENLKFDMRIYVLLCGTNPLRLYIYEQGLGRFATQKYVQPTNQNLDQQYMHLTNYAINKRNPKYMFNNSSANMGTGHKRSLKCIYEQLRKKGVNVQVLKEKINDLIIKTVITGLPLMSHQYKCCQPEDYAGNMCFHVLGFDVMLNDKQEPQLIEVNHTPSFATDTPLDYKIKFALVKDTLKLMRITSKQKNLGFGRARQSNMARLQNKKRLILDGAERQQRINLEQMNRNQYEDKHLGGYSKIYPLQDKQKMNYYNGLIDGSNKVHFSENTPIRIKMQEAEKKKYKQQNLNKVKHMKPKKHQDPIFKRSNTDSDKIPIDFQIPVNNIKKKALSNYQSNNPATDNRMVEDDTAPGGNNQQSEQIDTSLSDLYKKSNCLIDFNDSLKCPHKKMVHSEIYISQSQQTAVTKDQELTHSQNVIGSSDLKKRVGERIQRISRQDLGGKSISRALSIEKQLLDSENLNIGNTSKLLFPFSQKSMARSRQNSFNAKPILPVGSSTILEKQNRFISDISDVRKRHNSRERNGHQLPKLYDNSSCQVGGQIINKGANSKSKNKSACRQGKLINSIAYDMKQMINKKNLKRIMDKQQKKMELNQLICRKTNFNAGNRDQSQNSFSKQQIIIGPGGFVMPKMFQLNVDLERKIEKQQNVINSITKNKNLNNILPI